MSLVKSVLVLDDSEALLDLMKLVIETQCVCAVLTAKNFSEVEALGKETLSCQMAFLDINLGAGEPNGLDVYHWLRSYGFTKAIYFLTGHGRGYPLVTEAERLGDVKVLTKPFPTEDLIELIRAHL